jgi:hypothetical protein
LELGFKTELIEGLINTLTKSFATIYAKTIMQEALLHYKPEAFKTYVELSRKSRSDKSKKIH